MTGSRRLTLFGPVPPPFGGVAVHVERLAELLRDLGYQPALMTFGARNAVPGMHAVRVDQFGWPAGLARLAKGVGFGGLLHNHTPFTAYPSRHLGLMLDVAKLWRIGWVETLHDQTIVARYQEFSHRQRGLFDRAMLSAASIIAIGEPLRDFLLDIGVPQGRVVVGSPLLPPREHFWRVPKRFAAFIALRSPVWVTIGAFVPLYDFATTATAFRRLLLDEPEAGLVVVSGRFAVDHAYERHVHSILNDVEDHVMFLEDVPHAETQALLRSATILIRGPRVEAFGLSRAEGILAGIPVVATATGATEYMTLYQHGDVDTLLEATRQAGRVGPQALRRAAQHYGTLASQSLQQILDVYHDLGVRPAPANPT